MKAETALKTILFISIAGILFSGYLSYGELFAGQCALGVCSVIGKVPVCVYGLGMYLVIFIVSVLGLRRQK